MKRALLLAALLGGGAPAHAVGPPVVDDAHDLIVLHPSRPYRVRFHLRHGREAFLVPWGRQVNTLFRYLDTDGDGELSAREVALAPGREQWRQLSAGVGHVGPEAGPGLAAVAGVKKAATVDDLRAYYAPSSGGPLRVRGAWRYRGGDPVAASLFAALDKDRDGRLSRAELLAAGGVMKRFDEDGDEVVTAGELLGSRGFYQGMSVASPGPAHGVVSGGLPFFSARPAGGEEGVVKALMQRYDRDGDGALTARELGLDKGTFARLDGDGNGRLGAGELAAWRRMAPDGEVDVDLSRVGPGAVKVRAGQGGAPAVRAPVGVLLRVGDWWLELRNLGSAGARPGAAPDFKGRFAELDADGDGYITSAEVFRPPFRYVAWLRLADADGDGKLSRKEVERFTELQRSVSGVVTSLTVADQGRSLFAWLDSDGDQRLSLRELRGAAARLRDGGAGGAITAKEAPQSYVVTFWHGPLTPDGREPAFLRRAARPARGPVWFRKMDRNGDGDVSRSEWLGTAATFKKIDADGDGLIDASEAVKADRAYRKGE